MNKYIFFLFLNISLLFTSCISTRDLIYLQNKDGKDVEQTISAVAAKPYRLQTNDVLSISIKAIDPNLVSIFSTVNEGEAGKSASGLYFNGFTVDDHGNIRIPILGEMNVMGYTLDEIRQKIENQLLAEYFKKEANIFVTVKLAGFKYTINGEIGNTGTKTLFQDRVTIMEAIANSGDIALTGDRKAVRIMRQTPTGTQMHDIDLTDINVMQSPYYYLQPNDYIYIKPLKQKTWGTGKTLLESFSTFVTLLSFATTTFFLLKN
ncbi:polysaccharide biosynthesis/export family protein [Flavobacterium sp. NG2]|uniref:polysaccharide biosynthesis/export family protein n=1 Tax=Flavobacterium sp. NG2 TaxID=3097547 RepID=UPI002A8045BF|nr:polysaccharide biosynthesis/export family protein [Flavobacterium sp. NG2]WPR71663.1 polysaccharide biosynthesis/export family protein [Flavobacterium sp. NG2]